jgi:hypothetical protein
MCISVHELTHWLRQQMIVGLNTAIIRIPYGLHLQIFYKLLIYIFWRLFEDADSFSDNFTPYSRKFKE